MNKELLKLAFELLAEKLGAVLSDGDAVTIYLTGSAAALLRGDLDRDAKDCDIVGYEPTMIDTDIENATFDVATELNLKVDWLNTQSILFADYLPTKWKYRTETVFKSDNLNVRSLCRQDLITTKAMGILKTGDNKHRLDLENMNPSVYEVDLAIKYIKASGEKHNEDFSALVEELEKLQKDLDAHPD